MVFLHAGVPTDPGGIVPRGLTKSRREIRAAHSCLHQHRVQSWSRCQRQRTLCLEQSSTAVDG